MPNYLKIAFYVCVEVFIIILGGVVGAWLAVRDIPVDGGGPGDGFALIGFGMAGMVIGGMVGVVSLVVFWSVMEIRSKAAQRETGDVKSNTTQIEGVWPPPPKR